MIDKPLPAKAQKLLGIISFLVTPFFIYWQKS
jgi:hypothetical protein